MVTNAILEILKLLNASLILYEFVKRYAFKECMLFQIADPTSDKHSFLENLCGIIDSIKRI